MTNEQSTVAVNGFVITEEAIAQEVQHHPAKNFSEAHANAVKALVIKELLLQRAVASGIAPNHEACRKNPNSMIDDLLEKEVTTPQADKETCLRYYQNNKKRFCSSPLFEASHILFLAPPDDTARREEAFNMAENLHQKLHNNELAFKEAAQAHSQCSSAKDGGFLGQLTRGQTLPAFETALLAMQPNALSQPVETQVGWHLIYLHHREESQELPFEHVYSWIEEELNQKSWEKAIQQYISLLAGSASIEGFTLEEATSPLVQ